MKLTQSEVSVHCPSLTITAYDPFLEGMKCLEFAPLIICIRRAV